MSVTEKAEIVASKNSFDDDDVNFEEAVVVEAAAEGAENWAESDAGWESTNNANSADAAPDDNWASWNDSQKYQRQPSRDSQQKVYKIVSLNECFHLSFTINIIPIPLLTHHLKKTGDIFF